jgi:hypothetical protein
MNTELTSHNHDLRLRLLGLASMIEAYEMAAEYKENGCNKDLDYWSMFTNAKYVIAGVMDAHENLSVAIGDLK